MKALELQNLNKFYSLGVYGVNSLSLIVEKGDFFALLGPNGAGKTTTIGMIASLIQKSSGKIIVFDYDQDLEPELVKASIGIVPQEFNFSPFQFVKIDLINQAGFYGISKAVAEERADFYLQKLKIWEKRDLEIRYLSNGEKRRLMLARALIHEPPMLILDEPTAGIDVDARRMIWEMLLELNKNGTTIILSTHYLEEAEALCKTVAIMDKGHLIVHDSVKSLVQKNSENTFVIHFENDIKDKVEVFDEFDWHRVDDTIMEVHVNKINNIDKLLSIIAGHNLKVLSIHNKTNRLEEMFLALTSTL